MNLILCGLPGCGKTTIGQLVAHELGKRFLDTDRLIEQRYAFLRQSEASMTCREIVKKEGEAEFRLIEQAVIESIKALKNTVIATGGGALLSQSNRDTLRSMGQLIYLETDPSILFARITRNGMPTYLDLNDPQVSFQKIAAARTPIYEQACQTTIKVGSMSVQEIVETIVKMV